MARSYEGHIGQLIMSLRAGFEVPTDEAKATAKHANLLVQSKNRVPVHPRKYTSNYCI